VRLVLVLKALMAKQDWIGGSQSR